MKRMMKNDKETVVDARLFTDRLAVSAKWQHFLAPRSQSPRNAPIFSINCY